MLVIFIFTLFLLLPHNLYAHKVNIYAYTDGNMVYVDSYFADGSRCKSCDIVLYDKTSDKLLLEGKSDDNGKFSFKNPQAQSIKLVLKAGAGHQAFYTLKLRDISDDKIKKDIAEKSVQRDKIQTEKALCFTQSEIEDIVNQALDRKMQPLMNQLAALQESSSRAGIMQIIGGVGYIFGIMGILMYLKSRKAKDK